MTPVTSPVTVSGTGTQHVDLGPPPANANSIQIQFTCLTAGTFTFPDGASVGCDRADVNPQSATATWHLPVGQGQTSTTITAGAGQRWRLTAAYATATPIPWAVNADGQTYGQVSGRGTPDLVAAIATNGKTGYVYAKQLSGPKLTSPLRLARKR